MWAIIGPMAIPILTYHSVNVLGNDYSDNDHVALASDLVTITDAGFGIVPLEDAIRIALEERPHQPLVVLTFDDGAVFDYEDFEHPTHGHQKSFYRIMTEFADSHPDAQPMLHASSFVIVSPEARAAMDRIDFGGRNWWHDDWWQPAARSGLLSIENHSWDHNHPTVPKTAQKDNERGTFRNIDTRKECDAEIRQAAAYLQQRTGRASRFFAHPWGESSDYLRKEYLPSFGETIGLRAAFGVGPGYLTAKSERWNVPRFVCGSDWTSPDGLVRILDGAR